MDLDEDVELEFAGAAVERDELVVRESRDDEQDSVGAVGAGLRNWKSSRMKSLRRQGMETLWDASSRLRREPWKKGSR